MAATERTVPLSAEIADRLLDLLSTDDPFRAQFQTDPLAALRSIGYHSPLPGKMTACGLAPAAQLQPFADCKVENLADKDTIRASRSEIRTMLTAGLAQTAPQLDSGISAERRVRK
jgi:putative modified peptide